MKIKMLFMVSAFALGLASCSSDDAVESKSTIVDGDLKLKIDILPVATRAADIPVNNGAASTINTIDVYLLSAANVHSSYTISNSDDIAKLTGSEGYTLQKVNGNIQSVAIVVNKNHTNDRIANNTPFNTPTNNLKELALATNIANIQPDTQYKGVANAQMYGVAQIIDSGNKSDVTGNNIYSASIQLAPAIARVQVFGEVKHSSDIRDMKVTKIFLDNLYTDRANKDESDKFQVETSTGAELLTKLTNVGIFDISDAGLDIFNQKSDGVYAYHIFPQVAVTAPKPKDANVKLIVELTYTTESSTNPGTDVQVIEYATLRLAAAESENVVDSKLLDIQEAKIYTMDLGKVDWTGDGKYVDPTTPGVEDKDKDEFKPGTGGETPNQDQKDLNILVQIQEWEEVTIIPQN